MKIHQQKIINIQAYKHDGTLYRQWNGAKVIESSPQIIVVLMYKTKVLENKGARWIVHEPKIWFFPLQKQFFNTVALIRKNGIFYYTNIASVPIFEDNTIKFIDYDIDIKAYPHQKVRIVDKKEYEIHRKQFRYNYDLVTKIEETVKTVLQKIKTKEQYFNTQVINNYLVRLVETKDLATNFLKVDLKG